jgi:hypothetical protein
MASRAMTLVRVLAVLAMATTSACDSSPIDCSKIAPDDCDKHPECLSYVVGRWTEQCVVQFKPVGCGAADRPSCQLMFYIRDPAGTCWTTGECFVPAGWTSDHDNTCYQSEHARYLACFPDAGAGGPSPVPDASAP